MSTHPTNSYMVTNRAEPTSDLGQAPMTGAERADLWWYLSHNANDDDYRHFAKQSAAPAATPPAAFEEAISQQLQAQSKPSLTVFIHGLDCFWANAVKYTGLLGQHLAQAGYEGLVIGLSWPSNGVDDVFHYSDGYPPTVPASSWTVRGNILQSVDSFSSLMSWIAGLVADFQQQGRSLAVNIVSHSEGNFMLMEGAARLGAGAVNQVVMLAADINDGAFETPPAGLVGQAAAIANSAQRVTIYSSTNDPVLQDSIHYYTKCLPWPPVGTGAFHNPSYPQRLGLSGPNYPASQQANAIGVDCSAVVNDQTVLRLPAGVVPPNTSLHVVYFYIPQVLQDIAQTLLGQPAGEIAQRYANAPAGSYTMLALV